MIYKYIPAIISFAFTLTLVPNYKIHKIQFKYLFKNIDEQIVLNTLSIIKDLKYYKDNRDKIFSSYRYFNQNIEQIINSNPSLDDFACVKLYTHARDNFDSGWYDNLMLINQIAQSTSSLKTEFLHRLYTDYPNYILWKEKRFIDLVIGNECFNLLDNIVKNHYLRIHSHKKYHDCLFIIKTDQSENKYNCVLEYLNQLYLNHSNTKLFEFMKKQDYFSLYQTELLNAQTIKYNNNEITSEFLKLFNELEQDAKDTLTTNYVLQCWEDYKKMMMGEYLFKGYYYNAKNFWNMTDFVYLKNIQILFENKGRYDPNGELDRYVDFEFDKMKMTNLIELIDKYKNPK
jgi:hypothetical protein